MSHVNIRIMKNDGYVFIVLVIQTIIIKNLYLLYLSFDDFTAIISSKMFDILLSCGGWGVWSIYEK